MGYVVSKPTCFQNLIDGGALTEDLRDHCSRSNRIQELSLVLLVAMLILNP